MQTDITIKQCDKLIGMLQGIAVGDAIGLPAEGLSPSEIRRRWQNKWRMRLVFGHGMISDDTEHALLTAESLVANAIDPIRFKRSMAWKLRWWFIAVPPAVGLATARACLKLLCGWPANKSGVHSAGNGALIRAVVIGTLFADDAKKRAEFTRISTRLTHIDERAEIAANAIATVAALAARGESTRDVIAIVSAAGVNEHWKEICAQMSDAAENRKSVAEFAERLGLQKGISGYCFHTAPVVIYAWIKNHDDFQGSLESVLNCGGDTDSTGAIVGGLIGASKGRNAVPEEWLQRIWDWPNSVSRINKVGLALANHSAKLRMRWFFVFAQLPRNMFFFAVVLLHGIYRLLRRVFGRREHQTKDC